LPSDLKRLFLPVGIGVVSIFLWANIYEIRVFTDYAPFVIPAGVLGWRRCFAARGTLT
jgi:hypothetical protein